MSEPIIRYMGLLRFEDIPARLGIRGLSDLVIPVFARHERVLEAYVPDRYLQEEVEAMLVPIAEHASQEDMPIHYWRFVC